MVKSIFLETKTLSKKKKTFISFSYPFAQFFLDVTNKNVNYFLMNFFCLVSQTTDAGSSVKSVSLSIALGLFLAPLILPNT